MTHYDVRAGGILSTSVPMPTIHLEFKDLPTGTYELVKEDVEPGWVRIHARDVSNPYAPRTIRAFNVRFGQLAIEEVDPWAK